MGTIYTTAYTNSSYSVYEGTPSNSISSASYTTKNTPSSMHGYFTNSSAANGHYETMNTNNFGKTGGKYESYSSGPQEE